MEHHHPVLDVATHDSWVDVAYPVEPCGGVAHRRSQAGGGAEVIGRGQQPADVFNRHRSEQSDDLPAHRIREHLERDRIVEAAKRLDVQHDPAASQRHFPAQPAQVREPDGRDPILEAVVGAGPGAPNATGYSNEKRPRTSR